MATETVKVERQGQVALITLNRPQALNALNSQVLADLLDAFARFDADPTQRCAVIKGSDPGASEALYMHRLKAISERTKKLLTESVKLETVISTVANKGKRFSFFM